VKEIGGFGSCTSLCRIVIPSSVEIISQLGFYSCSALKEVIFASDCHVKEIGGFSACRSLRRIEIPRSVEVISADGLSECVLLRLAEFSRGSRMTKNLGFRRCKALIVYDEDHLCRMRRYWHLQLCMR
jgi:hypothetical protein